MHKGGLFCSISPSPGQHAFMLSGGLLGKSGNSEAMTVRPASDVKKEDRIQRGRMKSLALTISLELERYAK